MKTEEFGPKGGWFRRATAIASIVSVLAIPLGAAADDHRGWNSGWGNRGGGRAESWRPSGGDAGNWRRGDAGNWRRGGDYRPGARSYSAPPTVRNWRPEWRYRGHWDHHPGYGWRYQIRPGYWSPFYMWWWLDGRAVMGVAPVATVIRYSNGYYRLMGDGFITPYYWVWVPLVTAAPPPPPPGAPDLAPDAMMMEPGPEAGVVAEAPSGGGGREAAGTILGGIAGGLLGSTVGHGGGKAAGVLVGTLLGAILGNNVGRSLDEADELHAAHVLEKNRTGQGSTWVNPDSGAEVTVVPRRTYQRSSGEYCREYQTEIVVSGERQQAYGTACRQPDGQWKIVK